MEFEDIIYDKPNNESFKNKIKNIQYKACITITGAIQGTSCERLYQELSLECLETELPQGTLVSKHNLQPSLQNKNIKPQ